MASYSEDTIAKVESELRTFESGADARQYLKAAIKNWERRYEAIASGRVKFSASVKPAPTAADFVLTISGLNSMLARYNERAAA